jgi:hypothetical protein
MVFSFQFYKEKAPVPNDDEDDLPVVMNINDDDVYEAMIEHENIQKPQCRSKRIPARVSKIYCNDI